MLKQSNIWLQKLLEIAVLLATVASATILSDKLNVSTICRWEDIMDPW